MFQKYIPVPGGVENIPGDRPYGEADVLELLEVLVVSDDAGGTKNCRRISFGDEKVIGKQKQRADVAGCEGLESRRL